MWNEYRYDTNCTFWTVWLKKIHFFHAILIVCVFVKVRIKRKKHLFCFYFILVNRELGDSWVWSELKALWLGDTKNVTREVIKKKLFWYGTILSWDVWQNSHHLCLPVLLWAAGGGKKQTNWKSTHGSVVITGSYSPFFVHICSLSVDFITFTN